MHGSAIPITIVTGFLGAGKSTLLQTWLSELPREETAVIVNERGEVGIDGELLGAHVARLREIAGGCVCCSSQAELMRALIELSETSPRPSRILVETSGAASPAGVVRAVGSPRARERFYIDGVITVVDATRAREALEFDVAIEQLGFADVVVLSHADEARALALDEVERCVLQHAPAAVVTRAQHGVLSHGFLELLSRRTETLHVPSATSAHAAIESVAMIVTGELDEERFGHWVESALGDAAARILRVKGIVAMPDLDARVILQGVGGDVEVQLGTPWGAAERTSRLVVLGLGLDAEALEAGFLLCAHIAEPRRP